MNSELNLRPLAIALAVAATLAAATVVTVATALPAYAAGQEAAAPDEPSSKPWLDKSLSSDKRAKLALEAMTQQEKLNWVLGYFGADFVPNKTKKHPAALPFSAGYILSLIHI